MIIGSNGQLGTDLVKVLVGENVIPLTHQDIEITDILSVEEVVERVSPDVIINTAAYHNVPLCEEKPELAFKVNALGVRNLAIICERRAIKFVHISTDYVFDGLKRAPYVESDTPNPLNTYGISKLAGEFFAKWVREHYIIRVASLFGRTGCRAKGGTNFVEMMLDIAKRRKQINVTPKVFCSPTYTLDAAEKIKEIIKGEAPGVYHVVNKGGCSWYEFAKEIFNQAGMDVEVLPIEEKDIIRRPKYSILKSERIEQPRDWKDALRDYLTKRG
jgi:dTDP-4-dehydrorhamnose reductase